MTGEECLGAVLWVWTFALWVFVSLRSLRMESLTHLFAGLLSYWVVVDGMLLFYLVLIMDCFRNNPIWNPNAVSMPAGGEAQLLTVTDAVRFLQLWLTESTEHRRISSCLTSWLRR